METFKDIPVVSFKTQDDWRAWLLKNHDISTGVFIKIAKKSSGVQSIDTTQALDEALCFGWIDAVRYGLDETHYYQKYTPRRAKGTWSKVNIGKVTALIAAGKMHAAGQAAIDSAKADGRWERAYDSQANMTVPKDFLALLDTNPKAKTFFESLSKTEKYAFTFRLQTAKTEKTRTVRMEKFIELLNKNTRL